MKKFIALLSIMGAMSFIVSCALVRPLQPGAEKIIMTTQTAPKSCSYVGQVSAYDVNGSTQMYTSHKNLQADQINVMKNQALKLGANVIVVGVHQTTYMKRREGTLLVDTHNMSGNAYVCPANALNRITESNLSDMTDNQ